MGKLHALAAEVVALQAKARELGVFANDRGLLECPHCGLLENVACAGRLFTCRPESLAEDTGLDYGRSVYFHLDDGRVEVRSLKKGDRVL